MTNIRNEVAVITKDCRKYYPNTKTKEYKKENYTSIPLKSTP